MQTFSYLAKDSRNQEKAGLIEAPDERGAAALLRQHGLLAIDLKPKKSVQFPVVGTRFGRVSNTEVVNFTRQMATMVNAGLTITESLNLISEQISNKKLGRIISNVQRQVEGGKTLAESLSAYPETFSQIYVSLVKAAESAGVLDTILGRLADNLEREREFRQKIKGALIYPAIIVVAMIGVIFIMLVFVIPKLIELYKQFGAALPLPTRILIFASDFATKFWWLVIILVIGGNIAFSRFIKTAPGREIRDRLILRLPVWGKLKKNAILAEFARTLSLMVNAGIPILEALKSVGAALDNVIYRQALDDIALSVEKGFPLASAMNRPEIFPPIISQMVKTGEETGKLDEVLGRVAKYFESEAEQGVKTLTTAMEPLILIMLAFGVGFLILSVILPIYGLTAKF